MQKTKRKMVFMTANLRMKAINLKKHQKIMSQKEELKKLQSVNINELNIQELKEHCKDLMKLAKKSIIGELLDTGAEKEIYKSWLKRTEHITEDCSLCANKRYSLDYPITADRTMDHRPTINACPSCNFEDLKITQKSDPHPLHKYPKIKSGELSIDSLLEN